MKLRRMLLGAVLALSLAVGAVSASAYTAVPDLPDGALPPRSDIGTPAPPRGLSLLTEHDAYVSGVGNGRFEPERRLTRAEGAAMLWRLVDKSDLYLEPDNPYEDVSADAWYADAVLSLTAADAFDSIDPRFRPEEEMTRGEFVSMLVHVLDCGVSDAASFSDTAGHRYESDVRVATALGWVSGYGDGRFGPDDSLTRAQAVTVLNRASGRGPMHFETPMDGGVRFEDNADISAWYYYDVLEASVGHTCEMQDGHEVWTALK